MPVPLACPVSLTPDEHTQLESLVRAHSTPHALAFRCRLILRSAAPDRPSHVQVATALDGERHTVGRWRQRSLRHGLNGLQDAPRSVARGAFPPAERVDVLSMATRQPATYHCPATRWSLDDLVAALQQHRLQPMRRSSLWRILEEADLTPHRSVYWFNSHAPDFEATAHDICQLSVQALRVSHQGRVVICADDKTGMQMLQRRSPTQPVPSGQPEKREHESIRHGVRA